MNIHKGDNVQIMAGKDLGKRKKVIGVDPKEGKILVEGVNLYKKHQKAKRSGEKGEIVTMPKFFDASKAMLVCGSCDKPARVGYRIEEDGKKTRYCKKCQAQI